MYFQVEVITAGTKPLSGGFALVYPGHTFQESARTGELSVFASANDLASELGSLDNTGKLRVSRTGPSVEGEMSWTVTFMSGEGDVPTLQTVTDGIGGTDALVRVSTLANGIAPIGGTLSLVVYGVPGEVRQVGFCVGPEVNVLRYAENMQGFPRVRHLKLETYPDLNFILLFFVCYIRSLPSRRLTWTSAPHPPP